MDKILIGKRVREQRESLLLTREQFSEMIGISPQFLAEIENAKKGFSSETLYKICENTNASADYILFGDVSENCQKPIVQILGNLPPEYQNIIETMIFSLSKEINKDVKRQSHE